MQTMTAQPVQHDMLASAPAQPLALVEGVQALPQAVQVQNAVTPADLLRIAMERNDQDLDRLERLMAMQERYVEAQVRDRKREAELAFWRDFAALRGENIIVPLTKDVDRGRAGSFVQAEYHVAASMLSPALAKHGFSFRHDQRFGSRKWTTDGVESDMPWVWVTCFLSHRDGHIEKLELEGPPGDLSANTPVQNMQATASYLKRQSLLAITGTATGGEDNENALRKKPAGGNSDAPPSDLDEKRDAGQAAAMEGMAKLNEWWGSLTAKERTALTASYTAMRKCARQVDEGSKAAS